MQTELLSGEFQKVHQECADLNKRCYFLENRFKMVSDLILSRQNIIDKEIEKFTRFKPQIVKKNPLLDQRDNAHNIHNLKLMQSLPDNM